MAISVVQALVVSNATSGTLASPTTAGNCLAYVVASENSSNVTMTVTGATIGGSADNFSQAIAKQSGYANGVTQLASIWTDPNCAGGQTAVAVAGSNLNLTGSPGAGNGFIVLEISGLVTSSPVDASASNAATTGTSLSSGSTGSTAQASEIAVGGLSSDNTLSSFTAGYTVNSVAGGPFNSCGYQILSTTGTQSFGATESASGAWSAVLITLKAATSASFVPPEPGTFLQAVKRAAYY